MAPAKTGRDSSNNTVVIRIDHTKRGIFFKSIPSIRMFIIVVIKLIAPRIEEAPARWSLKIDRSTEADACARFPERGGYTVHPVPAPTPTNPPVRRRVREGGSNQNLMLFIRGKAISGAPIINGTNQLPNPPIKIGITMKKIIIKAWAVTTTL